VSGFRTMDEIVGDSMAQQRFQTTLVLLFACAALLLAGLGIYGVISYAVTQRTNEVGIRMALGAQAGDIRQMMIGQTVLPVSVGLATAVIASLGVDRLLSTLLYGVRAGDPWTIGSVVVLLSIVSLGAAYAPARRATHVDAVTALRCE